MGSSNSTPFICRFQKDDDQYGTDDIIVRHREIENGTKRFNYNVYIYSNNKYTGAKGTLYSNQELIVMENVIKRSNEWYIKFEERAFVNSEYITRTRQEILTVKKLPTPRISAFCREEINDFPRNCKIMFIGPPRAGKSCFLNTIHAAFKEGNVEELHTSWEAIQSVTQKKKATELKTKKNKTITLIDTKGLETIKENDEDITQLIASEDGIDLLVFVAPPHCENTNHENWQEIQTLRGDIPLIAFLGGASKIDDNLPNYQHSKILASERAMIAEKLVLNPSIVFVTASYPVGSYPSEIINNLALNNLVNILRAIPR